MRRLLMVLALVLVPGWAAAQTCYLCYHPPASGGSGTWDGGAFTSPATGPAGCANPAYSWATDATAGLCRLASGSFQIQSAASGARGIIGVRSTQADVGFNDAGSAFTGFTFEDDKAVFYASSVAKFQLGASPGTGLFTLRGGSTDAIARSIAAGTGISVANGDGQSGNPTVSVDTATTPQFSSGTGAPPATCTVGQTYLETDVPRSCECSATNTWVCSQSSRTHTTDCTALTDGLAGDLCWELDSERAFLCQPTAGGCDAAGEWIAQTVSAAQISSGDIAFSQIAQASGASVLLGRGSAGGAGDFQEITLGSGLSMSGTALSASGSSSFNPATTVELYEEFLGGELSADRIGTHGLRHVALSSANPAYVASTTVHPGLFRLESSASDNSTAIIATSGGGSSFYNVFDSSLLNTYDWQFDVLILMGSNSTALTSSAIWMGWTTSLTGTPDGQGNGIWIRRDTDLSDSSFMFQVCDGAGGTGCASADDNTNTDVIASTITPSAGTYYRLRMRFDPTGVGGNPTLYMRVNDETELTFCSSGCDDTIDDMPGSGVGLGYFFVGYAARAGSAVRSGDVDYLYIKVENIARY